MRKVLCPTCKKECLYSPENIFRPFCSERCRLIDLGEWASESYRMVAQSQSPDETSEDESDSRRNSEDTDSES